MIFGLDIGIFIFLFLCLALVAIFEFINGFHDTANAVAPVIYTKSLKPRKAVLIAGVMNFLGVVLGGIGVAMAIVHLLPLDAIGSQSTTFGIIVIVSLLLSAIIWNFATWFFGIPASSSHSLIGAILGVTITMTLIPIEGDSVVTPNWGKALEVIESLLFSPLVGFFLASIVMYFSYKLIKRRYYFSSPGKGNKKSRPWLRVLLIGTSAWVSFAHGSNDGQKGVGLAVLILVLLAPASFAVNPNMKVDDIQNAIVSMEAEIVFQETQELDTDIRHTLEMTQLQLTNIKDILTTRDTIDKKALREEVLRLDTNITKIENMTSQTDTKGNIAQAASGISKQIQLKDNQFYNNAATISQIVDYAPRWVIVLISFSLGMGTMVGRKRIVTTIGEKIGKSELTYAQATTSALITGITITLASRFHLPVSTTHILSSSVAGTMTNCPDGGCGIKKKTIKHIVMAWVLTMPVTIILSASIFFVLWFMLIK